MPEMLQELLFQGDYLKVTQIVKMRMRIEKAVLALRRKISRWIPNGYTLRRHYPEIAERDRAYLFGAGLMRIPLFHDEVLLWDGDDISYPVKKVFS